MTVAAAVMEHTVAYRLWQAPFATRKLAPFLRHNDLSAMRRVLDVGCGPGTNSAHFGHTDYLGVDINPRYIAYARRMHRGNFIVADATALGVNVGREAGFDVVLANSLFHHIATPDTRRILTHLGTLVSDDGHLHVLDLVLPSRPSAARLLAHLDRGEYPRPVAEWESLLTTSFETVVFECYPVQALGTTLWEMIYFKGRPRR